MTHKSYIQICNIIANESKANRYKVGAILVKDGNIISMGYNGTPSGFDNECEDENGNTKVEVLHAESNAITKCAKSTKSSENSILYCTLSPCVECAKLIVQSGIKEVYFKEFYRDSKGLILLSKANIKYEIVDMD